jgi:L-asparaginase
MAGAVYAGSEVQKTHCYRLDAFDAADASALAYVEEGRLRMVRPWPVGDTRPTCPSHGYQRMERWPRVEIVMSHAGASAFMVEALLAHSLATGDPVDGIVVAGTGNGTVHEELEGALLRAQARGVVVWRSTRCSRGQVLPTDKDALHAAIGLSPVKARIAMLLQMLEQQAAAG